VEVSFEASILLAASRGNSTALLKEAAATYKVDTDAITAKVRQEFSANEKTEPTAPPFLCLQNRAERTRFAASLVPN